MLDERPASEDDRVVVEREISSTPARVYRALTDPEQLDQWWQELGAPAHWEMDIRPGAGWHATVGDARDRMHGIVGEVLDAHPPLLLTCLWTETSESRPAPVRSTVVYEVVPTNAGAVVRVTQSGVTDARAARERWADLLSALERYLARPARGPRRP